MKSCVLLSVFLFVSHSVSVAGIDTPTLFLSKHQGWIEKGLTWERAERAPDSNEKYRVGRILYFGADRKFGMFQMNIVRNGGIGLDEGDGGRIYSGDWALSDSNVRVRYRLVDAYKLILPNDQQPEVPGPVEERQISLANLKITAPEFEFEAKEYQPTVAIKISSLRELLRAFDKDKGK